jgi:hypothetical protein
MTGDEIKRDYDKIDMGLSPELLCTELTLLCKELGIAPVYLPMNRFDFNATREAIEKELEDGGHIQ